LRASRTRTAILSKPCARLGPPFRLTGGEQFVFGPDDIIMTFGQDGLVANVAKYLDGQTVIGVDPAPGANAGVLARFRLNEVGEALQAAAAHAIPVERRVMAEARLDNGENLLALNEIFVGHRSHQSARYALKVGEIVERQSSSGLIVSTGTGLTGWASSILNATGRTLELAPTVPRLGFLVREPGRAPTWALDLSPAMSMPSR
jgi:NAD kinase